LTHPADRGNIRHPRRGISGERDPRGVPGDRATNRTERARPTPR